MATIVDNVPRLVKPLKKFNKQPNFITNTREDLSVMEKRIVYLVLNQMHLSEPDQRTFNIVASKLSKDTNGVRNAMNRLLKRQYVVIDDNNRTSRFMPFCDYDWVYNQGIITISIHNHAHRIFTQTTKGYTTFQLQAALLLSSTYSQKVYEYVSSWKEKKKVRVWVHELAGLLGADHLEYRFFKRNCLMPAMREINEKTDITFVFEEEKQARSVVALHLQIHVKKPGDLKFGNGENPAIGNIMLSTADFSPADIAAAMNQLYHTYTFSDAQVQRLIDEPGLFRHFVKIDSLIRDGAVTVKTTPTRYAAGVLFKKNAGTKPAGNAVSSAARSGDFRDKKAAGAGRSAHQEQKIGDILQQQLTIPTLPNLQSAS